MQSDIGFCNTSVNCELVGDRGMTEPSLDGTGVVTFVGSPVTTAGFARMLERLRTPPRWN
jgi:hypothetical protein